jgi:hypothetical protein
LAAGCCEEIALVEPFEPPAEQSPRFTSDKEFKTRVVLIDRYSVLTEDTVEAFGEANNFRRLPDDNVATNPAVHQRGITVQWLQRDIGRRRFGHGIEYGVANFRVKLRVHHHEVCLLANGELVDARVETRDLRGHSRRHLDQVSGIDRKIMPGCVSNLQEHSGASGRTPVRSDSHGQAGQAPCPAAFHP